MTHATPAPSSRQPMPAQAWLRGFLCLALCLLVAACGFRMKGATPLPFQTLYTNISPDTEFGIQLRRAILATSPGLQLRDHPDGAQARLVQLSNHRTLRDISIDARGRVEEYELNLEFTFQVTDDKGHFLLPPTTLRVSREMPYDPDAVQSKQGEIDSIFRNMQQSLVDRITRRLTAPDLAQAYANASGQPRDEGAADLPPQTTEDPLPTPWNPAPLAR